MLFVVFCSVMFTIFIVSVVCDQLEMQMCTILCNVRLHHRRLHSLFTTCSRINSCPSGPLQNTIVQHGYWAGPEGPRSRQKGRYIVKRMHRQTTYDSLQHHVAVVVAVVIVVDVVVIIIDVYSHFLQLVRECMPFGPVSKYPCAAIIYWILGRARRASQSIKRSLHRQTTNVIQHRRQQENPSYNSLCLLCFEVHQ